MLKTNINDNITQVVTAKLCNSCGACFGICPSMAIHYEETVGGHYLPVVNGEACIHCGLCLEVCPGIHFAKTLTSNMPQDLFGGQSLESFVGKSTDKKIFENSQSGGIVSALLVHALETGRITGAVTVTMHPGFPPRPMFTIVRSREEILQAQKSKYCPVPLLGFFKDLKNHEGPVAVVGTSCQIHGLKNVLDKKPELQNRIAFNIGLVCDRVLTYSALDYLITKSAIKNHENPLQIHFRDKTVSGYPGDVHVFCVDGGSVVMPAKIRMEVKNYFTPARCRLCFDKMNLFSDVTVGDPHGLEGVDRKRGESMLVARTVLGQEIIKSARIGQSINVRPVAYAQILEGQRMDKKKEQWHGYALAWKELGQKVPDFFLQIMDPAYTAINTSIYENDLKHSLSLDEFDSRNDLIQFVAKACRKKQTVDGLLKPFRLIKRILRKRLNKQLEKHK